MAIILFNIWLVIGAAVAAGGLFWYFRKVRPNK